MITDEMLAQAAAELADAINDSLPSPSECTHQFSPRFEKKMKRLIRKTHHPIFYRTLRTVASIVLVILIGFGSTLAVSAEAREIVFGWVKQQYENYYEYFFEGEVGAEKPSGYNPGWLPNGYEFYSSYELPNGESYVYTDQQDSILQLTYTSSAEGTSLFLDTVKYKQTETLVNGMPGTIYIALSNDETNAIVWTDEKQEILFYISGPLNEEDLIKMAESIEPKK